VDDNTLKEFQQMLQKEKNEILQQKINFAQLQGEKIPDEVDAASHDIELSTSTALIKRKNIFLAKIDLALGRLKDGYYGECEDCSDEIDLKRLRARPTAILCIGCAELKELHEKRGNSRRGYLDHEN
jgi:DnaK suppressor protein